MAFPRLVKPHPKYFHVLCVVLQKVIYSRNVTAVDKYLTYVLRISKVVNVLMLLKPKKVLTPV